MQQNIEALKQLVKLENLRDRLARRGDFKLLRKTYQGMGKQYNGNTGIFWDHRFDIEHVEQTVNHVERDRNQTAYNWLLQLIQPGSRVLNVGCGDGKFESCFDLENFNGVAYEGVDFAQASIRSLKKRFPQFHFWSGDIVKETFAHKFDMVCMFEVLEHISAEKVLPLIAKLFDSIEKGGHILVAVPSNEPLLEMFPANPNEHVRLYTKDLICAELKMAGFVVLKVEEFIAFPSLYGVKKFLAKTVLKNHWKPNDLLTVAKKR